MGYEMDYKGLTLYFNSVMDALKHFDRINDAKVKSLFFKKDDDSPRILLKRAIFVGKGSNLRAKGYKVMDNNDLLFNLKQRESVTCPIIWK